MVRTLSSQSRGTEVRSLLRELRSHKVHGEKTSQQEKLCVAVKLFLSLSLTLLDSDLKDSHGEVRSTQIIFLQLQSSVL